MSTKLKEVEDHIRSLGVAPQVIVELENALTISVTNGNRIYQIVIFVEHEGDSVRFRSFKLGQAVCKRGIVCDILADLNAERPIVRGSIDDDGEVVLDLTLLLADMPLTRKATTTALGILVKNMVLLDEQLRGVAGAPIQA